MSQLNIPENKAAEVVNPKVAERKAARKARKAAEKASKLFLADLIKDSKFAEALSKLHAEIVPAIQSLVTAPARTSTKGASGKVAAVVKLFTTANEISEFEIFKATKMGNGEMRKMRTKLIRDMAPEARIWLNHDEANEKWIVAGRGAAIPKGWNGPSLKATKE